MGSYGCIARAEYNTGTVYTGAGGACTNEKFQMVLRKAKAEGAAGAGRAWRAACEATRRARGSCLPESAMPTAKRNANTQLCMGRGLRQRALETRDSRNWPRRRFQGLGALGQNMRICATCLPSSAGRPLLVLFTRDLYGSRRVTAVGSQSRKIRDQTFPD